MSRGRTKHIVRIVSIIAGLSLACAAAVLPMAALGDDGDSTTAVGSLNDVSVLATGYNSVDAATVYYGGNAWRVIGYNGNGIASTTNQATLLAARNMGTTIFDGSGQNINEYSGSTLRTKIDEIAGGLSTVERAGIDARTLEGGSSSGVDEGWDGNKISGPTVQNALLWPLSETEAFLMDHKTEDKSLRLPDYVSVNDDGLWWLRSPGTYSNKVASVGRYGVDGHSNYAEGSNVYYPKGGIRPAFWLDLNSVILVSPAENGKPSTVSSELSSVGTYTGNAWKTTLYDSARSGFAVDEAFSDGYTCAVHYSGATVGENEYISVLYKDDAGKITHYGKIAQVTAASGVATFDVNGKLSSGTLYLLNEQCNANGKTDYASMPTAFTIFSGRNITVSANPVAGGTVSGGGMYPLADSVTITATPVEGYHFVSWTEGDTVFADASTFTFSASESCVLVANFELNSYDVLATASDAALGEVSGAGTFTHGSSATVTATPVEGYHFVSWTENSQVVSSEASYTFQVTGPRELVANFELTPISIESAKVALSSTTFTYNGKVQKPELKTIGGMALEEGVDYTAAWSNASSKDVGSYKVTITGKGAYVGSATASYKIVKAANTLKVTAKKPVVKFAKLKKKAQKVKKAAALSVTLGKGTVSYKLTGVTKKKFKSSFTVSKKGVITVKRGLAKGTYTLKLQVKAAGTKNYKPATKTVSVKLKVK